MELGIHYANFTLPGGPEAIGPTLAATAKAAEDGGYAKLGVSLVEVMPTGPDPAAFAAELGEKVVPKLKEV
jgi:hypothetical protein